MFKGEEWPRYVSLPEVLLAFAWPSSSSFLPREFGAELAQGTHPGFG